MEEWQYFDQDPRVQEPALPQPVAPRVVGQPSQLKRAGQFAGGLLTRAAQAPFHLAELPANIVSAVTGKQPGQKPLSKRIGEAGEQLFGDIEPENIVSKGLQYTAGNWPFLFLGGAPTAAKLGADIAGSTALAATEKVTDNPIVGIGAHILGQKGFKDVSGWLKKAPKNPGKIRNYISSLYDTEKELGSKIVVRPDSIEKKLNDIYSDLRKEYVNPGKFDEAARSRVMTNLQNAEQSISHPKLTVADLSAEKRRLNKAWAYKNSTEASYYDRIKDAFKDELDSLSKSNSGWGKAYKTADELHSIDKWQSNLGQWVDSVSGKGRFSSLVPNPIAQSGLALLGGFVKGTPYALAGAVGPAIGKAAIKGGDAAAKGVQFLNSLGRTTQGRRLLMNIVVDSAQENSNALTKNIHKFNKMADEYEKQEDAWEYFD